MISDSEMYAEAFEILACMNKQDVMKIPVDILEFLKKEKSKTYITRIDKDDILNPNNIDQRTINFLNGLNITYIADEEEKEKIIEICKTNDRKNEKLKKEKFSSAVLNNTKDENNSESVEEKQLIDIKKKSNIFVRILEFFKRRSNATRIK